MHWDIKYDNIMIDFRHDKEFAQIVGGKRFDLITVNSKFKVVLIDLGLCKIDISNNSSMQRGNPKFKSPEAYDDRYSIKSDTFSIGALTLDLHSEAAIKEYG